MSKKHLFVGAASAALALSALLPLPTIAAEAAAKTDAKPCLIAGWEQPAKVCVVPPAKICAAALVELFNGREPNPYPVIGNTRYSATSDETSGPIAVLKRYDVDKGAYIRQPGGGASEERDELNFEHNKNWFENIWADTLG